MSTTPKSIGTTYSDEFTRSRVYDVHGVPPYVSSEFDENNGWRIGWNRASGQTRPDSAGRLIADNHFSQHEPGVFAPIFDALLRHGDHYLHLADLKSYSDAHTRLGELYTDQEAWSDKAVLNIAGSGMFSSDRTIAEYAKDTWQAKACPVD